MSARALIQTVMTGNHQSDRTDLVDELVKAARTDRTALGQLFDRFYPSISGFLEAFSGRGGFPAVIAGREWQVFESQHGRLEFTLSAIAVLG